MEFIRKFEVYYVTYKTPSQYDDSYDSEYEVIAPGTGTILLTVPTIEGENWHNGLWYIDENTLLWSRWNEHTAQAEYHWLCADGSLEPAEADFLIMNQCHGGRFVVYKPADPSQIGVSMLPSERSWLYGVVDKDMKTVLLPIEYEGQVYIDSKIPNSTYSCFYDGHMIQRKDGKYGLFDFGLNLVLPFEYDYLHFDRNQILKYRKGTEDGIIFLESMTAVPGTILLGDVGSNLFVVKNGESYHVVDRTGKVHYTASVAAEKQFSTDGQGRLTYGGESLGRAFGTQNVYITSGWARDYTYSAEENGIVPTKFSQPYKHAITRRNFCDLAMSLVKVLRPELYVQTEAWYEAQADSTFYDTEFSEAESADYAAHLGIITGYPDGSFRPFQTITRQEAATILQRLATLLKIETNGEPLMFTDLGTASEYAREAISAVSAFETPENARLMNGIGEDKFDPLGSYTVEQAIVTMYRLYLLDHDPGILGRKCYSAGNCGVPDILGHLSIQQRFHLPFPGGKCSHRGRTAECFLGAS